ncbi:hypothetical protein D9613_010224 [Agrocybe pediades]|uniref:Uncharacterized protein n=1 Tax=Agrocybe pediades TaxID=84607 RepID=A0A8H4VJ97_9AGAR|nr:hypothetical protein D9613_010224 [Agrocybe pediades]
MQGCRDATIAYTIVSGMDLQHHKLVLSCRPHRRIKACCVGRAFETFIVFPIMSTADDFSFSIAQQKTYISSDLNSTLLLQFLFGIYTGLFPATVYIYVHKENRTRTRDMIIIGSTGALYFLTGLSLVMNWLYTNILLGTHGATRAEMFIESVYQDVPLGNEIIENLTSFFVFLFADGLMVWRCFHSCGRLFRRSLLPIALFILETVLVLAAMAYGFLNDAKPNFETIQTIQISNHLNAATLVIAAATSLVSTVVICLQIWRHTTLSSRSRKHYQSVINALIESSAIYTVALLFLAILDFTYTNNIQSSFTILLLSNFFNGATQITSGLAPTLMIAQLFVSSDQELENTEVSSARLPSDLISHASHATGTHMTNVGIDLEMQQSGSVELQDRVNSIV